MATCLHRSNASVVEMGGLDMAVSGHGHQCSVQLVSIKTWKGSHSKFNLDQLIRAERLSDLIPQTDGVAADQAA